MSHGRQNEMIPQQLPPLLYDFSIKSKQNKGSLNVTRKELEMVSAQMKAKKSHLHYEGVLSVWWMFPSKFRDEGMVYKSYCLTMLLKQQWVCTMPHSHQINMFNLGPVYTNRDIFWNRILFLHESTLRPHDFRWIRSPSRIF